MKTIVASTVFFFLAIMPLMTQGIGHQTTKTLLDRMASKGGNIKKIFQPSKNGCLGYGMSGLTYKGILLTMGIEVAMKFISHEFENYAKNEHQAYTALGAVNNTEIEAMGIPTLYHYGKWRNYFMFGITLLDSEFSKRIENHQLTTVDILIVFHEVVRISKFHHLHGIVHNDLILKNIMFRVNQCFIIDYNLAIDAKKFMPVVNKCAKRDWEKFLADIASTVGVNYDWTKQLTNPIDKFKNIEPEGLKRVFCEFANTTFGDGALNYNELSDIISEEIERYYGHFPALVSWITPDQLLAGLTIH